MHPLSPPGSRLSNRVQEIPASGIRRYFDLMAEMDGVISLGVGEPDFTTPAPFVQAAFMAVQAGRTKYTSNYGLSALREAVAEHLYRLYGVVYDPSSEILITTGVSEGIDLACRVLLNPGDEAIGHDPSFVAYDPLVSLTGARFVPAPTPARDGFQLRAAAVEALITERTRVLILNYPCNPTGAVLSRPEAEAIADVAKRRDLIVISDEIYDQLVYGAPHVCIAALPEMRERTVLLGGFSKAYAMTGWRVGYVAAPAPILEGMMKVHQYGMMSAPTPGQYAALEALRIGEPYVRQMLGEYDARRRIVLRGLREMGLETYEAQGAFYLFPSIANTGLSDEEFMERLLMEEQVVVVPGSAFGAEGRGHVRLCYAASQAVLEEALARIGRFLGRLRG